MSSRTLDMVAEAPAQESHALPSDRIFRFGFVMEQQAGMRTQYLNWRSVAQHEPNVDATFVPITYYEDGGWIERMRFLPYQVRAIWRGTLQMKRGLGDTVYDAVLFNTHIPAVYYPPAVRRYRAFLMFDVTPCQYDAMARWYRPGQRRYRQGAIARWRERRIRHTFQAAVGLFPWSRWAAQSVIEDYGADPERVFILPPGVDTELWCPDPQQKPDDGVVRMLFTGGNFERKGGDLLLRWARETRRRNWELHMVTLDQADAPAGVFIHNGVQSNSGELIRLAQRCDLFVLPTRADCFSIASLEAMAAGLPVIVSDVGGIADIVDDGESGYLIPVDNYEALHDRLEYLLDRPELCRQMGQRGRAIVQQRFQLADQVRRGLRIMAEYC